MIQFKNLSQEIPYLIFKDKYNDSIKANQSQIEAISIASYSLKKKEVNARFVNLKFVNNKEFIFFSNYKSPKSQDFNSHSQITALIYWNSINMQIRIKAKIKPTSREYNLAYFAQRDKKKNALAISSDQSSQIASYDDVYKNYDKSLKTDCLTECPKYWGGYSFTPYYFEFWEGHELRLNKRDVYEMKSSKWQHTILQP
ncbi:pyridoxamine 5'-phosphate oxidase family protein [Gammaproteobacteria bacterium]|nr:pyridoxamine 5'-phosphate oxidase family protein [Gammaproteobacteria bacterium]